MYSSDGFLTRMINVGALGYFMKGNDFQGLTAVIRKEMGIQGS